jgi:hypothetical protein
MDPFAHLSTTTAAALPRPQRGSVVDTVRVAPETFGSLIYMAAAERKEFTEDRRPNNQKPQKKTSNGIPLWSIKLAASDWRGNATLLTVTVPMHDDPTASFTAGQVVELVGLVFGVTPKRDGRYVTWCSADGMTPVAVDKLVAAWVPQTV